MFGIGLELVIKILEQTHTETSHSIWYQIVNQLTDFYKVSFQCLWCCLLINTSVSSLQMYWSSVLGWIEEIKLVENTSFEQGWARRFRISNFKLANSRLRKTISVLTKSKIVPITFWISEVSGVTKFNSIYGWLLW